MKNLFMLTLLGMFGLSFTACDREGPVEERTEEMGEGLEEAGEEVDQTFDN